MAPRTAHAWSCAWVPLLLSCAGGGEGGPEPAPRLADTPGDVELREAVLSGAGRVEDLRKLATSRNPKNVDCVAAVFNDSERDYALRLEALLALRGLRETDPPEYGRIYATVRATLSMEASRGMQPTLAAEELRALEESMAWHAERRYVHAKYMMILTLEHSPYERVRVAAARGLGKYAGEKDASSALEKAVGDPRLSEPVREAARASLREARTP